jgi:glycosyltransferase involved in cell wall biosynthesis
MTHSPTVSICVAAFNAERFLGRALDSLLRQTFRDFEVVVVDDGSSDRTAEIASEYAEIDERVRVLRNEANRGLVFTRNRCLSEARSAFLAIADADDISEANRLAAQLSFLEDHPDVGAVGADVILIDEHDRETGLLPQQFYGADDVRFFLLFGPCLHNPTTIYRRDVLEQVGGYSDGFDGGAEDYDLWTRLSAFTKLENLKEPLVRYRRHATSVTADRTRVDENIFAISARAIGNYASIQVTPNEGRIFHQWLIKQGMEPLQSNVALRIARVVLKVAEERERPGTLKRLREMLADSAWTQAEYLIYRDKRLSRELAAFANQLEPHAIAARLWYGFRSVMPSRLRLLARKFTGASGLL